MSLRLRLILAFTALVSLIVLVGLTSFGISQGLRREVSGLRSAKGADLRRVDLANVSLEIEGFWSPLGKFVATEVDVLPGQRRPKLRGPIQDVDRAHGTITLFGVRISVDGTTEFNDLAGGVEEALITTAAGLLVAIPTYLIYNIFVYYIDSITIELERSATRITGSMR